MQECSLFFTPSPAFIACRLFDDGHSDWCEAVSHCSFDLHFFNSEWCLASFQVLVSHLHVFFGEMSLQVPFPLFDWVVCFSRFCPFCEWHLCLGFYNVYVFSCLCPTLCDPMDCSPPGSSAHGILQARILEWVAMPSSRGSSWSGDQTLVSLCLLLW